MPLCICLVAHFSYGALSGGVDGHVGGVEQQIALMARWLARQGCKVSVITWDEGQPDNEEIDGIQIIKLCRRDQGWPGLRFFYPRWSSLNNALIQANADIYYQNCAEYVTGQVAMWCKQNHRKFVYSVASDPDCDPKLPTMKTWREQYLYRYGLYHADKIIVQTNRQQAMLHDGFKLNAIVAKMPCLGPSDEEYQNAIKSKENKELRILWVGRISREKQAEIFLTAAEYLPQLSFDLVGGTDQDADYTQAILTKAGKLPNVKIHGKVPRKNMPDVYKNASLLCCTSRYEGFPNTFLEGWSYGLPIISTVDPDNLIDSEKLGYVVKDSEQLKSALVELSSNPILLKQFSERSRIYYRKNHKLDQAMAVFLDIFAAAAQR